jgi:hypothetical protein
MRPQADYTTKDFLNDLLTDLTEASINTPQGSNIDIVTFANSILFNDSTTKLWPTQEAILKAIYNEPLDQVHIDILDRWREQGKTNWINGRKYTNLILEAGRGCPTADSEIITSVGTITYKELHERSNENIKIYTIDPNTYNLFTTNKFKTWDQGLQQTYKIKLRTGKEEKVTDNHPYLVWRNSLPEWVKIKDLIRGDRIAVLNNLPLFGTQSIGNNKAALLGYLLGDGGISTKSAVTFTNMDSKIINEIKDILLVEFPEVEIKVSGNTKKYQYRLSGEKGSRSKLLEWLRTIEVQGKKAIHKYIPSCVKQAPKKEVAIFLSRLFACDGYSHIGKTNKSHPNPKCNIGICLASELFILDIQKELIKFGISSKVKYKASKCNNKIFDAWCLTIDEKPSLRLFIKEIGIFSKQDKLDEIFEITENYESQCKLDTIPKPVWLRIKENQTKLGLTNRNITGGKDPDDLRLRTQYSPCKNKVKTYATNTKDSLLLDIVNSSIQWDEVDYIEDIGLQPIIGFEVEDTHIIANSIVSHNSSKSSMSSIICLYEFYKLISLPDPGLHYGLMSFSPIALFAIAQTEAQVLETSFKAIKSFLEGSNFFKSLIKKKKIIILSDEIKCPEKYISLYAKHTNSKALVGYNLKLLFIDEMARFETTGDGINTGLNIYQNVGRALNRFKGEGKKIVVSSAWSFTDPMVTLKHQAAGDPYSLIMELTCFDVNPNITRSSPDIISDYSSEPKRSRLEYENIRSSNDNSFLDADLLDKLCCLQSSIDVMEYNLDIEDRGYRGIKIHRISNVNTACFIHVDTSLKKDATALSIATINNRGQIEIIGVACWTPGIDERGVFREVSYINIEEILIYISQYMNIMSISFDGFNSSSLNQNLYSRGLNTKIVSFSRDKQLSYYNLLKQLIQRGDVLFPIDSPWTAIIKTDLPSLVIKDNGQIVHPYGTKDLPDALAVSVFEAYTYGSNCNLINKIELKAPKLLNINSPRKITVGSSINRLQQHKERNRYRGY